MDWCLQSVSVCSSIQFGKSQEIYLKESATTLQMLLVLRLMSMMEATTGIIITVWHASLFGLFDQWIKYYRIDCGSIHNQW
jgi:hypothetical protein